MHDRKPDGFAQRLLLIHPPKHLVTKKPLLQQGSKGHDYGEKADLSKTIWNLKRRMWVTMHFSEIIIKQP